MTTTLGPHHIAILRNNKFIALARAVLDLLRNNKLRPGAIDTIHGMVRFVLEFTPPEKSVDQTLLWLDHIPSRKLLAHGKSPWCRRRGWRKYGKTKRKVARLPLKDNERCRISSSWTHEGDLVCHFVEYMFFTGDVTYKMYLAHTHRVDTYSLPGAFGLQAHEQLSESDDPKAESQETTAIDASVQSGRMTPRTTAETLLSLDFNNVPDMPKNNDNNNNKESYVDDEEEYNFLRGIYSTNQDMFDFDFVDMDDLADMDCSSSFTLGDDMFANIMPLPTLTQAHVDTANSTACGQ